MKDVILLPLIHLVIAANFGLGYFLKHWLAVWRIFVLL